MLGVIFCLAYPLIQALRSGPNLHANMPVLVISAIMFWVFLPQLLLGYRKWLQSRVSLLERAIPVRTAFKSRRSLWSYDCRLEFRDDPGALRRSIELAERGSKTENGQEARETPDGFIESDVFFDARTAEPIAWGHRGTLMSVDQNNRRNEYLFTPFWRPVTDTWQLSETSHR